MQEAETGEEQAQGQDRRIMPRCPVDEEAALLLVGRGNRMQCRIVELSLTGCRMSIRERLLAGSGTRVEATFKVQGIAFRFGGEIEWADDENLVGIRFVDLILRRRDELIEVLCELEAEAAAKREKEVAEQRAAEEQAKQESEKQAAGQFEALPFLDQLWAAPLEIKAKQAPDPVWAAQPAKSVLEPIAVPIPAAAPLAVRSQSPGPQPPEFEPPSQRPTKASKRERRLQSRHEVDTSAVIFLINVGAKLGGRILDLSAGGCRIRTDERFPVGIYTRVETEFLLEGLPIRLGGVIQSLHDRDRRLVGIRFLDMSARKRELLGQLIEEIEEMQGGQNRANPTDSGKAAVAVAAPESAPQIPVAAL
jgi:c-di-GMP-binding flagellar brake protein YcgR